MNERAAADFETLYQNMVEELARAYIKALDTAKGGPEPPEDGSDPLWLQTANPLNITHVDTAEVVRRQSELWQQHWELLGNTMKAFFGGKTEPLIKEAKSDRRFQSKNWNENPFFSYFKQAYLLNTKALEDSFEAFSFGDEASQERARFMLRQFINTWSPSNSAFTNPEVVQEIIASHGNNLREGMNNFLRDLRDSPIEAFRIAQAPRDAFTVGKDLAITPGKVVFQNELLQLIHYTPSTDTVYSIPLLITPPFINKFYIMDLDPEVSLMQWLVEQGYSVFMISWVNPDVSLAHKGFDDYVCEGVIAAVDTVEAISGSSEINAVGFCVGGTLLATAQAYMVANGDKRIKNLTLLTTLLDFTEPGELGYYVTKPMVQVLEKIAERRGVFDGRIMGFSFNLLRENALFWSYFINNYLKGKSPEPFNILYWNCDSTNLTSTCYSFYLRNTYLENKLKEPGGISIKGTPIDLSQIDSPTFVLACESDHIVLWQSAYDSAKLLSGPTKFVLAGSGHLAGVINSTRSNKYPHWVNDALPARANTWRKGTKEISGSWWPTWHDWLAPLSGEQVAAPTVGSNPDYPALEDAPGSYVMKRL